MRRFILILLLGIEVASCNGQEFKRNNNWVLGFSPAVVLDFNTNPNISVDSLNNLGLTLGASDISDTNGNLQFISGGFNVIKSDASSFIEGGDTINCPSGNKLHNYYYGDGLFDQMSIILPKKNNSYYVFTTGMSDSAYDDWKVYQTDFRFDVLNYAVVDMDANGGLGKVTSKNNIIMQHARLSHNRMTAVKHGNGKDWWLIKPHKSEQTFYSFRVSEDSIYSPIIQHLSAFPPISTGASGQSVFNTNGTMYAYTTADYVAKYYLANFDRCSGHFEENRQIIIPNDTASFGDDWCMGVAFSPNDSFLYVSTRYSIWQIDIYDTSLNGYVKLGGPDTLLNYFPKYSTLQLAPNGSIYIGNYNATLKSMDYIENPNVKGIGCNFRGRGNGAFVQAYTNLWHPPNMPNYGLRGNGLCWPLSNGDLILENREWSVYPNPASNNVTIAYKLSATDEAQFVLYDIIGREVKNIKLFQNTTKTTFVVSDLMTGIYAYKYIVNGSLIASGKLSIQ